MIDISVVVPTRDRVDRLSETLAGLARQQVDGIACELIVVDNGSSAQVRERLERVMASRRWPFPVRVVDEPARGAAAARNAGVGAAAGSVVLFLGDDCRPLGGDVVAGHLRAHSGSGPNAVVGHIAWDPAAEVNDVMRWLERTGKMLDYPRLAHVEPGAFLFYTGNASVTRAAILAAGGFDERFQGYGWEDYELALRLADAGTSFSYEPSLRVVHAHHYELRDSLGRMRAMGHGAELINRLYSDRREPPAPQPRGLKGAAGRVLAPVLTKVPPPPAGDRVREAWFRAAHFSALAAGHGRAPLPASRSLQGGVRESRAPGQRPPVSVVVPFHGSAEEGRGLLEELRRLGLRDGDEAIVADNTAEGVLMDLEPEHARLVHAPAERSSYYARNIGAEVARSEWLLFVDSDCRFRSGLADALLDPLPADAVGAVAGSVVGAPDQDSLVARYARARGHLDQGAHMEHPHRPFAVTANLLVRRAAWEDVGGFLESIRSGGDADFSWRIQHFGWRLEYRPRAAVEHNHRESVRAIARQNLRYGAGRAWIARQHEGSFSRPRATRRLARAVAAGGAWLARAQPERAAFSALDAVVVASECAGWVLSNSSVRPRPRAQAGEGRPIVALADRFPELSETFVSGEFAALSSAGRHVRVEAASRPLRPNREALRSMRVDYLTDDGLLRRAAAVGALVARHPLRASRDLVQRRNWKGEETPRTLRALGSRARRIEAAGEEHLHVHFADTAALDAHRLGALLKRPYSVSAHAYDVFVDPRNLECKLAAASFTTAPARYTIEYMKSLVSPAAGEHIRLQPVGVDTKRFRRRHAYPGGRTVLAVGRLVEKKGFGNLVQAAALLRDEAPLDGVRIVGAGPLLEELRSLVSELGLGEVVELLGARDHHAVRELMETADVLAMPCVVAADGDRDSLPTVVYEALAMEVPVVASREVGLPEVIRPEWGGLVPPGDPEALARGLSELLGKSSEERTAMGRAGRAWVVAERDATKLAAELGALIDAPRGA